jgi:hypothetical protein
MEGSVFSRSTAMTARQVSHGSVIVLIRFLLTALIQQVPRPRRRFPRCDKGLLDQLRKLV